MASRTSPPRKISSSVSSSALPSVFVRPIVTMHFASAPTLLRLSEGLSPCLRDAAARIADDPPIRVVMLDVLPPRDPAEDHRLRDPPFVRTHREVDVRDHEADQPDAGQAVPHVDEAPRRIR